MTDAPAIVDGRVSGGEDGKPGVTPVVGSADTDPTAAWSPRWRARLAGYRGDLAALCLFLLGAFWVTGHGWVHPFSRVLGSQPHDVLFNEWMLANAAHAISHLQNPFFSSLQNAPLGVNLMTNVGMQLPGVLLAPITLTAGPVMTYLILITANLAATGFAWYWVLSRNVVKSRIGAFVGGLFCAFAPDIISHSNGHPHITAQYLAPIIAWQVLGLARGDRVVRRGLVLGLLITAQFLLGEEMLLILAVGLVAALVAYVVLRPRDALAVARPFLTGAVVAVAVVLVLSAYPLWMQFFGPQHRDGAPETPEFTSLKVGSFFAYARQSVAGNSATATGLAQNQTEEASFFGWPLAIFVTGIVLWLRRETIVRTLAFAGVVGAVLSLGSRITWRHRSLGPGPFALLQHAPVVNDLVVGRFAIITTSVIGVLLAIGIDRFLAVAAQARHVNLPLRLIGAVALIAVLVPVAPMPLQVTGRAPMPTFITSGDWKSYVRPGRTLVPMPVNGITSIAWGAAAGVGFAVPVGYFVGPTSPTDPHGRWGVAPQPTANLVNSVAAGNTPPDVTADQKAQAARDAAYWKAQAIVLPKTGFRPEVLTVLTNLYGSPRSVDDVWVWPIAS